MEIYLQGALVGRGEERHVPHPRQPQAAGIDLKSYFRISSWQGRLKEPTAEIIRNLYAGIYKESTDTAVGGIPSVPGSGMLESSGRGKPGPA